MTDRQCTPLQFAALAATSLAIGVAAISSSGAAASTDAAASTTGIPYVSVLQAKAVRRNGQIVGGRIRLRGLIGADGLRTTWSIRTIHRRGEKVVYRIVAHGTVAPKEESKPISAVVFGKRGSVVDYDVTATNSAGGQPTPDDARPDRARLKHSHDCTSPPASRPLAARMQVRSGRSRGADPGHGYDRPCADRSAATVEGSGDRRPCSAGVRRSVGGE